MRILLAGRFAGVPDQGGATWAVLQYALGFERLGHEVLLVEPAPAAPEVVACFEVATGGAHLAGRAALLHGGRRTTGMAWSEVAAFAAGADVLINLAGVLTDEELLDAVSLRVFVDLDPAFTQLWHAVEGIDMGLASHHRFVTVGQAVGTAGCAVPTCGVAWIPTLPPVVLEAWPVAAGRPHYGLTTVGNWRSYGSITHGGVQYGQKAHSMRALLDLPSALGTGVVCEPALALDAGEGADLGALARHGWRRQDPAAVAGDPSRYRSFVQASTAELGVAKAGYVVSRCGWFSDRSACYLASGRPVVAQDTGWPEFLPAGEGLLAFSDTAGAAAAAGEVLDGYERHRKAARAVAEEYLDSGPVLSHLLDAVGAT
ncbi:MAG: glycosyltransferase [Acidimicrobiales bacterium]